MDESDIKNFVDDIMSFLTKEDIKELHEKAGVKFPLEPGLNWSDLCYICCWMGLKAPLPRSIHNRMMLGEQNDWVKIYIRGCKAHGDKIMIDDLFNLAG
jgi:hypothetical protein